VDHVAYLQRFCNLSSQCSLLGSTVPDLGNITMEAGWLGTPLRHPPRAPCKSAHIRLSQVRGP
jgi:hypothetical protein